MPEVGWDDLELRTLVVLLDEDYNRMSDPSEVWFYPEGDQWVSRCEKHFHIPVTRGGNLAFMLIHDIESDEVFVVNFGGEAPLREGNLAHLDSISFSGYQHSGGEVSGA